MSKRKQCASDDARLQKVLRLLEDELTSRDVGDLPGDRAWFDMWLPAMESATDTVVHLLALKSGVHGAVDGKDHWADAMQSTIQASTNLLALNNSPAKDEDIIPKTRESADKDIVPETRESADDTDKGIVPETRESVVDTHTFPCPICQTLYSGNSQACSLKCMFSYSL